MSERASLCSRSLPLGGSFQRVVVDVGGDRSPGFAHSCRMVLDERHQWLRIAGMTGAADARFGAFARPGAFQHCDADRGIPLPRRTGGGRKRVMRLGTTRLCSGGIERPTVRRAPASSGLRQGAYAASLPPEILLAGRADDLSGGRLSPPTAAVGRGPHLHQWWNVVRPIAAGSLIHTQLLVACTRHAALAFWCQTTLSLA